MPRGIDRDATPVGFQAAPGRFDRQVGMVALPAQVQENDVAKDAGLRAGADGRQKLGGLIVRQMAAVAEIAPISCGDRLESR